jgi:hypothetical protein
MSPPTKRAVPILSPGHFGDSFRERAVVVRIDGKRSRIALLVSAPAPGFYCVRLAWGRGGRYRHKLRRIITAELVRDATPREVTLGHVVAATGGMP